MLGLIQSRAENTATKSATEMHRVLILGLNVTRLGESSVKLHMTSIISPDVDALKL